MKTITTFAAGILSIVAFGQEIEKSKSSSDLKRIHLGVNISPDYCNRILKNNKRDPIISSINDNRDKQEQKLGYSLGTNLCYNYSKDLGIELGFQYSNKGYMNRLKAAEIPLGLDPNNQIYGIIATPNGLVTGVDIVKYIYNLHYLDIPFRAILSFGKKRIRFVTSVGITTNIFLKATQTQVLEFENGDIKRYEPQDWERDYKTFNISPTVSIGLDYKISNKLNLRVEPTFRYGLLKISDASISNYLWSGGFNIICYYVLK
jgi:hypothetical protein